ncbi:hypothetical protein KY342_04905 [Candidatus Woesearchaeota archaeon]|nr:hypothetical protein [Candidatus Woesearchaeota archaeon]
MKEEYWIKYGFKEDGDLVCVKVISNSKPDENFFYTENGEHKEVRNPNVLKLTKELIEKLEIIEKVQDLKK